MTAPGMPLASTETALPATQAPPAEVLAARPKTSRKRQPKVDALIQAHREGKLTAEEALAKIAAVVSTPRKPRTYSDPIKRLTGMARRAIARFGREIAEGDVSLLKDLLALKKDVDAAADAGVAGLRAQGYSWQAIADALGTTKQAAEKRWGGKQ